MTRTVEVKEDRIKQYQLHDIKQYQLHDKDTGSTEVQVAQLTDRILALTEHFKVHPKDFSLKTGLLKLVAQRRKLLGYLERKDAQKYLKVMAALGLSKK